MGNQRKHPSCPQQMHNPLLNRMDLLMTEPAVMQSKNKALKRKKGSCYRSILGWGPRQVQQSQRMDFVPALQMSARQRLSVETTKTVSAQSKPGPKSPKTKTNKSVRHIPRAGAAKKCTSRTTADDTGDEGSALQTVRLLERKCVFMCCYTTLYAHHALV
jgi:hypothetical protein